MSGLPRKWRSPHSERPLHVQTLIQAVEHSLIVYMYDVLEKLHPAPLFGLICVVRFYFDSWEDIVLEVLEYGCAQDQSRSQIVVVLLSKLLFRVVHVPEHLFSSGP